MTGAYFLILVHFFKRGRGWVECGHIPWVSECPAASVCDYVSDMPMWTYRRLTPYSIIVMIIIVVYYYYYYLFTTTMIELLDSR